MSGPETDYETLKANPTLPTLQAEFNRVTGRTDLVVKEVTYWQGDWRLATVTVTTLNMTSDYSIELIFVWWRSSVLDVYSS